MRGFNDLHLGLRWGRAPVGRILAAWEEFFSPVFMRFLWRGVFFFFLSVPEDGSLSFSLGSTAGWSPDARRVSWDGPASAQAEREFAYLGGFGKLVVAVEYPFCFLPLDARVLLSCSAWLESFLVIGLISFYPLAVARACIRYAAWQQYY